MTWTIAEAVDLVKEINPQVREFEFHVMLGGSVLYAGESNDDLDLYFCPLNGHDGMKGKLITFLISRFGLLYPIRDSPDYHAGDPWYWTELLSNKSKDKKIDFFIR